MTPAPAGPRRNRVTPFSELIADPARGLVFGNRGNLHNAAGEIRRRAGIVHWISCRLEWKDWRRSPLMQPGRYTELFFLDEATALAAGHRPCALCRRADYRRYLEIAGASGADELDARLQRERVDGSRQRHHDAPYVELPDGAFVLREAAAWIVHAGSLSRWTPAGYAETVALPSGGARVITPETSLTVLRSGWEGAVPLCHPSLDRRK